jgi:hypothetical protein
MKVELQYFADCPNWRTAERRLRHLSAERRFEIERRLVSTPQEAEVAGFRGSPTIVVDGRDPFAQGDEPVGLACRVYQTPEGPAGSPTLQQLRAVLGIGSVDQRGPSITTRRSNDG